MAVLSLHWASLVAQMVKRLFTMRETWVQSLGWEDSLEKEMATHFSTLALKIPWTKELGAGYYPWDFEDKSTGVGCRFLLQGIFPTQGSNPSLSDCRQTLYCLSHKGSPE